MSTWPHLPASFGPSLLQCATARRELRASRLTVHVDHLPIVPLTDAPTSTNARVLLPLLAHPHGSPSSRVMWALPCAAP